VGVSIGREDECWGAKDFLSFYLFLFEGLKHECHVYQLEHELS